MLKSGCLNSPKFLLQSIFPEDWKLLYQPEQEPLSCPSLLVAERIFSKYQFQLAISLHFFHILLFGHCQGKDPGLEGCLVSVSLEVLALYGWCTAAHHFYATAQASKRPVTVLPAALMENLLLLCYIQEIPCGLWSCGVLCTADSYWYQSWLY